VAVPADNRVIVFDTSLRDGEQSPGFSLTTSQKLRMARSLCALKVDVLEAGFAASSPGDFESVRQIAMEADGPIVCSLARATEGDIEAAGEALAPATRKRIHVFLATSPIHRKAKLKMSRDEVLKAAVEGVAMARSVTDDVQFSPEDAGRTEMDFLVEVVGSTIAAGATTINLPDTVGYLTPEEMYEMIATVRQRVPNIDQARISVHCHNDLGLAAANSLAALRAGARQVECTINGIGERAGNAALEEIVMALRTRPEAFNLETGIDTRQLYPASRMLAELTGNPVPRNKAIVGRNAFAHEAGIHQHGVLQDAATYEIMLPQDVGVPESRLVLGKHSGRHALSARLAALGHSPIDDEFERLFADFKIMADRKQEITDIDLESLVSEIVCPANRAREHVSGSIRAIYR
jgi:2-isopropylmalate synthase